ncbi:MAG: hypothetical protein SGCHY_001373 [Lobulomycetales sp.]
MGKALEPTLIVLGRSLALTVPRLLPEVLFKPFNLFGFIALAGSLVVAGLELNHERIGKPILLLKVGLYSFFGLACFFNLTTLPAAYCLFPTSLVFAAALDTPPPPTVPTDQFQTKL